MDEKKRLDSLSDNLIAFVYQYLSIKEISCIFRAAKKYYRAFQKDFIYETLARNQYLFLPSESNKFMTWKEYFFYLSQLQKNVSNGKPNKGYKMIPYRGHKKYITALEIFNSKKEISYIIVSGDDEGNLFTWNINEDGDKEKDLIKNTNNERIAGIINVKNEDSKMLVWTKNNNFYLFEVDMTILETERNSKRFNLLEEFKVGKNSSFKQISFDTNEEFIFMSPDLNDSNTKDFIIYGYNIKGKKAIEYEITFSKNERESIEKAISDNNDVNKDFLKNMKESRRKFVQYFIIKEEKIITYINYEPVSKKLLGNLRYSVGNTRLNSENIFIFDKKNGTNVHYHINFDYIFNIYDFQDDYTGIIGFSNNLLKLSTYSLSFLNAKYEINLVNNPQNGILNISAFDICYFSYPAMYYVVNNKNYYKIILNQKTPKPTNICELKDIKDINCVEGDELRLIFATDNSFLSIHDRPTGDFWFGLFGGSQTVKPKSFVDNPNYKGFNKIKLTRYSIVGVIGNLIREYKFVFNK